MENRTRYYCLALILLTITACAPAPAETAPVTIPQPSPTETAPVTIPQPTLTPIPSKGALALTASFIATLIETPPINDSRWYGLTTPIAYTTLTSPVRFIGETNMTPQTPTVYVTLLDSRALVFAQVKVTIQGTANQPGTFFGTIFFSPYDGPGWITIRETPGGTDIYTAAVTFQTQKP